VLDLNVEPLPPNQHDVGDYRTDRPGGQLACYHTPVEHPGGWGVEFPQAQLLAHACRVAVVEPELSIPAGTRERPNLR
jgi:hypothetical protein